MQTALNCVKTVTNDWAKSLSIDLIHRFLCMLKMLSGITIYCVSLRREQSLKCNDHIKNQAFLKGLNTLFCLLVKEVL